MFIGVDGNPRTVSGVSEIRRKINSLMLYPLPPLAFKPTCEKCNREHGESCQNCGLDVGTQCECCERCGPGFSIQMRRYLQYNVRPPGVSVAYVDNWDGHPMGKVSVGDGPTVSIKRVVFCTCRVPGSLATDPMERCVLRELHDGDHQCNDGRRWTNEKCSARCVVKNEVYSPVQCDRAAGHDGDHEAWRGDGVSESNHWTWDESLSIPTWVPRAYVAPAKKRSLWSIVREFFARRRHTRPPEGGPTT